MNPATRAGAWVVTHPAIVLGVGLAVALFGWLHACNHGREVETRLGQAQEAAQVAASGAATALAVSQEALEEEIAQRARAEARATGRISDLERQVQTLLSASGGARVVVVQHGDTGWVPSSSTAQVHPAGATQGTPSGQAGTIPAQPATPPGRACFFAPGDQGRIETTVVEARYQHGTVGVVGIADAYRRNPATGAGEFLFGGPLKLDVKVLAENVRPPGWSYGLGAGGGDTGILFALKVETPPWQVPLIGRPARLWAVGAAGAAHGLLLGGVSIEP